MKKMVRLFAVILLISGVFISCDGLDGPDKPSNKTLAFFPFNDDVLDAMDRYDGDAVASPGFADGMGAETATTPRTIVLNGTTQYVNVTGLTQSFNGDFSVAAWINPDALSAYTPIVSKGTGGDGAAEFVFFVDALGALNLTIGDGGSGFNVKTSNGDITTGGGWYYVAATVSGDTATLYINPTKLSNAAAATGTFTGTRALGSMSLLIGKYDAAFFDGSVDQVRIANYAYSAYGLGAYHDEED